MHYEHLQHIVLASIFCGLVSTVFAKKELKAALIIIDVQDCFLPGGSLAVSKGDIILPVINSIRDNNTFDMTVFTLDWHHPQHVSFASTHNKSIGDTVRLEYLQNGDLCLNDTVTSAIFSSSVNCSNNRNTTKFVEQKMWPDHCVQNVTTGPTSSKLSADLKRDSADVLVYKGTHQEIDSYSAFFDNGKFFSTDMNIKLQARNITTVFIMGFAFDICVFYTSLHAKELGYDTYTVVDASMAVYPEHVDNVKEKLQAAGIHLIKHTDIPNVLRNHSTNLFVPCLALILATAVLSRNLLPRWFAE